MLLCIGSAKANAGLEKKTENVSVYARAEPQENGNVTFEWWNGT